MTLLAVEGAAYFFLTNSEFRSPLCHETLGEGPDEPGWRKDFSAIQRAPHGSIGEVLSDRGEKVDGSISSSDVLLVAYNREKLESE